jgi:hypothetical protein
MWQLSQPPLSTLMQVPLQGRLDESVVALQYMYPKSFIHQSTVSSRKTPRQELKQKHVVPTLYCVSVSISLVINIFTSLADAIPHACWIMWRQKYLTDLPVFKYRRMIT